MSADGVVRTAQKQSPSFLPLPPHLRTPSHTQHSHHNRLTGVRLIDFILRTVCLAEAFIVGDGILDRGTGDVSSPSLLFPFLFYPCGDGLFVTAFPVRPCGPRGNARALVQIGWTFNGLLVTFPSYSLD